MKTVPLLLAVLLVGAVSAPAQTWLTDPAFGARRDAYGLGVHMDASGRAYRDTPNSAGDVVGSMGAGGLTNTNAHGFLWSNGVVTDLGPGTAVGINASGQVLLDDYALGGINDAGHVAQGDSLYLSWPAGTPTNLGNLGNPDPAATNAYPSTTLTS